MSIFKEIPPTAGLPLCGKDFLATFNKKNCQGSLEEDFQGYLGVPYARVTYSGTAALYLILESLKNLSSKKTVVIPAYICPLVPLAIRRAGLKVAVCDINKDDFNFDIRSLKEICLEGGDILAVVAVHLAGIPVDLEAVKEVAGRHGIFLIEDCAQSLGASYKGKKTGTLGDFSFFSLCRGKGLTIYEGGVITTSRREDCQNLDSVLEKLVKDDHLSEALKIFELFGYWMLYRPGLFWFAFGLPQAYWDWRHDRIRAAGDYFTVDFDTHNVSKTRKLFGHIAFCRLEGEIARQREKALIYIKSLEGVKGIRPVAEPQYCRSNYPYLTLLFDDPLKRQKARKAFAGSGLGVSQIYESAITDYAYLKDTVGSGGCPNARSVAEREITLSTCAFMKKKDMDSVVSTIKNL